MRPRPPPVAWLAGALVAGSLLSTVFVSHLSLLIPLALLLRPVLLFLRPASSRPASSGPAPQARPARRGVWPSIALGALAGALATAAHRGAAEHDCRLSIPDGARGPVTGWFEASPGVGTRPFHLLDGLGCQGEIRVIWRTPDSTVVPGTPVRGVGRWQRASHPSGVVPERAGVLFLEEVHAGAPVGGHRLGRARARLRGRVETRMRELLPDTWPMASALILARKEGLDPELREAFALAGIAHLLAISGFHVGVVAVLVGLLVRRLGAGPRRAPVLAAGVTWLYVAFIGFPDAATRAALMLTLVASSRLRSRPTGALGAIATALLALFFLDPFALGRPGFQLSFAGALGLVVVAPPIRRAFDARWLRRVPASLKDGVAAGVGATLLTLPFVAWHFGRVSLVGIPATLLATPLVAAVIPGLMATLAVSWLSPPLAAFLAGGTDLLLRGIEVVALALGSLPGASLWVGSAALAGAVAGLLGGAAWLRAGRERLRPSVRWAVMILCTLAGVGAAPLVERALGLGSLEIVFLDVGQGDAVAIRSPAGRWVLVDTGPRGRTYDAGARVVLPYLRRRGVTRLETLVLTHADMDHIGGAGAVLAGLEVGFVLDPAQAVGKDAYVELLEAAGARNVEWVEARRGSVIELDGVELVVLHPDGRASTPSGKSDSNAQSVVLLVRFGAFEALLTGDAPTEVEEAALRDLPHDVEVLKVGHHGSKTSTSQRLLSHISPTLAVISVGARNRYGHPAAAVLRRLAESGARVLRTDRVGHIRVRARRTGLYEVRTQWRER